MKMGGRLMKLHLGCGKRDFGLEWVHADCGNYPHIQFQDITSLPYEDNTCDTIYASHVIEYFDREAIFDVLKEWCRVLKPGCIIRLAVPDFEAMTRLYQLGKMPIEMFLGPLYGKMQPSGCKAIYHKTVYDFSSLESLLKTVGFDNVRPYDWRQTEHGHIDDHSQAYIPHMDKMNGTLISLNVEGTKVR